MKDNILYKRLEKIISILSDDDAFCNDHMRELQELNSIKDKLKYE